MPLHPQRQVRILELRLDPALAESANRPPFLLEAQLHVDGRIGNLRCRRGEQSRPAGVAAICDFALGGADAGHLRARRERSRGDEGATFVFGGYIAEYDRLSLWTDLES